jgi:hypothetical protein
MGKKSKRRSAAHERPDKGTPLKNGTLRVSKAPAAAPRRTTSQQAPPYQPLKMATWPFLIL